jgi:hypothetical protein
MEYGETTAWVCVWVPEFPDYPRNGVGRWEPSHPVDRDPDDPESLNVGDGSWLADYYAENAEAREGPNGEPDANLYAVCLIGGGVENEKIVATFDGATGELALRGVGRRVVEIVDAARHDKPASVTTGRSGRSSRRYAEAYALLREHGLVSEIGALLSEHEAAAMDEIAAERSQTDGE